MTATIAPPPFENRGLIAPGRDPTDPNLIEDIEQPTQKNRRRWIRVASIIVVMLLWEVGGRLSNPLFMAPPSAILIAGWGLVQSGELAVALGSSLSTLLAGFVIASVIGVLLGLVIGRYRDVEAATDWIVNALYATPLVALIPLVILWFGLGGTAKLVIVVLLAVFPVLINTISGVRNVPTALIDVGNAFAANEREIFVKIIMPSALPYIMTGLRLGIGRAIIGMVVAEFFTAITGLGALITKYQNQYDTAAMFVPILILMLLGIGLTLAVRRTEQWIAPWRETEE